MMDLKTLRIAFVAGALALAATIVPAIAPASEGEKPVERDYSRVAAPAAPKVQTQEMADAKSAGCVSCHTASDEWTMHAPKSVVLGCTDCHGGDTKALAPTGQPRARGTRVSTVRDYDGS